MRRDLVLVLLVAAAAFGIRTYPAGPAVFSAEGVRFLETDAWYHVRLIEHQVANFPFRLTFDPFAAPGGQFVPIAPLFDTLTATVVVLIHGRGAPSAAIERTAALMPPLLGALTVIVVWALARRLFDRRAGLLAAVLLAVLPGHFMDRTMLGFVDHHALEALLAVCVLFTFARGLTAPSVTAWLAAGLVLGLYLLSWGSGALLVAIIAVWLVIVVIRGPADEQLGGATTLSLVAAVVALAMVVSFQDAAMHRYGSQVLALAGLATLSGVIKGAMAVTRHRRLPSRATLLAGVTVVAVAALATTIMLAGDLVAGMIIDARRLVPDASRMGVLEARPLFLYSGAWDWTQPWKFFRTGVFIGLVALVPFAIRAWRGNRIADLLLLVFTVAMFAATVGQNRFGYYLVTACALVGGWLAAALLDWGGVPHAGNRAPTPHTRLPLAREIAVVAVAGVMIAPNLAPGVLLAQRSANYPPYWRDTMQWLRDHTPPPFARGGADYYYARYENSTVPAPDYAVMSWWDQGYWITQQARRVPVANPTQAQASTAGRFYSATDEGEALAIARATRSRYVVSDYELPFRQLADGTIMGRFQTIVDWTGAAHDPFYEVAYRRAGGGWTTVWIFHEAYYRSMAFRLSVLGGAAAAGTKATVVRLADRLDTNGLGFREIVSEESFADYDSARRAVDSFAGRRVVGLDPWESPFPIEALTAFQQVYAARTPDQKAGETPWVRVFEVR